jgi:peroxiredoxin
VKLKTLLSDEQKRTTKVLAVSVDGPENLQMMVDRISEEDSVPPDFPFLSDPGHAVINRYGLFNAEDPKGREITHPATFVIDTDGVVRWKMVEVNYKIRPTNEDVLRELAALDAVSR